MVQMAALCSKKKKSICNIFNVNVPSNSRKQDTDGNYQMEEKQAGFFLFKNRFNDSQVIN